MAAHFHIRWSTKTELDWERFDCRDEAVVSAEELRRPGETCTIEEHGDGCPRCASLRAGRQQRLAYKYPWQEFVQKALSETDRIKLALKINAAERAIAERTSLLNLQDLQEQAAIREALQILRMLVESQRSSAETDEKKEIA